MTDLLDLDGRELERELDRIIKANPPRVKPWTEKEKLVARKLYAAGVSVGVISKKLDRTPSSVMNFLTHENLKHSA